MKLWHLIIWNYTKKLCVLKEIAFDYSGKTIDNIIVQMESRIHELDKYVTKE